MCTSTPDVPSIPERQAVKLPDQGATTTRDSSLSSKRRKAIYAGMITGPQGALGNPDSVKPTLG